MSHALSLRIAAPDVLTVKWSMKATMNPYLYTDKINKYVWCLIFLLLLRPMCLIRKHMCDILGGVCTAFCKHAPQAGT